MKNKQSALMIFLLVQMYIYIMLICFNNLINQKILSFLSIFLCLIIGLFLHCKTKDYYIMILSLIFTLIGDVFFTFFEKLNFIGLIFFNIVQILYFLRIYIDSDDKKSNILTRLISLPLLLFIGFIILKNKMDISVILWIIFTTNLFININFTIKEIGINNFFPIGLLLMFIHSISLMFVYLPEYINVNIRFLDFIIELPFDIKHVFYIPSIIVLTCSIFTVNRKCFSKIKNEEEN